MASEVTCGHAPGRVAVRGVPRLQVQGQPVLTRAGVLGGAVAGCGTLPTTDAAGVVQDQRCTRVTALDAGTATRLFVDGVPVLLDSLAGGTDGLVAKAPTRALGAAAAQTKLEAQ